MIRIYFNKKTMSEICSLEEKHVFRLQSMLNKEGRYVLILCMNYLLPGFAGRSFEEYLDQDHIKERIKEGLEKSKIITFDQYLKFYPHSGSPNMDDLDICLLVFLIRQLHPFIKVSNKIWSDPLDSNMSIEACIARLRDIRNMLYHLGVASLTKTEFEREYSRLEMILMRLIENVGTNKITPQEMKTRLELKKKGTLEAKPIQKDVFTNMSDSLEKISKTEQNTSVDNKTTSTSSLQKMKFCEVRQSSRDRSCFKISKLLPCLSCCKHIVNRTMMANDHSALEYRCSITSLTFLKNGTLMMTDKVHNVVEAFSKSGQSFQEYKCQTPNSICAINNDTVVVSLCKESKLLVISINDQSMTMTLKSEYTVNSSCDIVCIKYNVGFVYVLCENGEIHAIKSTTGADQAVYKTGVQSPSYFDLSPDGEFIYITKGTNITRLRLHLPGDNCQTYSDRHGRALKGICVRHSGVFVSVWDGDVVLKLDKQLRLVSEKHVENLKNPMDIHKYKRHWYLSKFKTDLNEQDCREIVVAKL